jgi:DegV family protein with EDD domain
VFILAEYACEEKDMPEIAIVTDTGCDLPDETLQQYGIDAVPMVVRFGQEEYFENQLSGDEFWSKATQVPPYPQTSQVPVGLFEEAFSKHVEQGQHVLCLAITSKHSGTYNSACSAAKAFPGQVTVVDTLQFSLVQGYMAIRAAQAAAEGWSLERIIALVDSIRARTQFVFAMDTVEYLRRGGRADQVMPLLDRLVRMLNIKPLLNVVEGQITPIGAARSRERAMERITRELAKYAPGEMLFVLHTRLHDQVHDFAEAVAQRLDFPLERAMVAELGLVLSCHAGPRVIGAAMVQQEAQPRSVPLADPADISAC